jgi:hypothetical protein
MPCYSILIQLLISTFMAPHLLVKHILAEKHLIDTQYKSSRSKNNNMGHSWFGQMLCRQNSF